MPDITDPNSPDLSPVSADPSQPLPEMAPDSSLVPYRTGSQQPGGPYAYTTGYGQRGSRQAIQPPGGGGAGLPDLGPIYSEAFARLPVDEAIKATEIATRYIGQRGYNQDLQAGKNAAEAFAKWGPMLFKTATGIPEAIDRSVPTPITPQQMILNSMAERRLNDAEKKTAQGDVRVVGGGLYRIKPGAATPETLLAPKPPAGPTMTETYKVDAVEGQPAAPASTSLKLSTDWPFVRRVPVPARPAVAAQPEKTIRKTIKGTSDVSADEEAQAAAESLQAAPPSVATEKKRVKVKGPDGRTGTIAEGDTLPSGWTTLK